MAETFISFFAGLLLISLLLVVARYAAYKADHPYTAEDIKRARKEAITGSQRTRGGQAAEQIATLLPAFCAKFNPKEAHFLGKPVDFIIFDGLEEGDLREVVFLEVKSGARQELNKNERQVRRLIAERNVRFEVLNPLREELPVT
jgi:predicted Holliday junction resolvase-like endonuclease